MPQDPCLRRRCFGAFDDLAMRRRLKGVAGEPIIPAGASDLASGEEFTGRVVTGVSVTGVSVTGVEATTWPPNATVLQQSCFESPCTQHCPRRARGHDVR